MDISSLAALAGNTLVTAAVTDAWETARHRFARLFGRGEPDPVTERRLEATRSQLAAASADGREQMRADMAGQWALRLADLLEEDPELAAELRALVVKTRTQLPAETVAAADQAAAAGRYVNISALQAAVAAVMLPEDVMPPDPTRPGPVRSSPGPRPGSLSPTRSLAPRAECRSVSWCSTARYRVRPYR